MRNIAIVEDNDNDASLLESHIKQISETEKVAFNVQRFHSATEFLKDFKPIYSMNHKNIILTFLNLQFNINIS